MRGICGNTGGGVDQETSDAIVGLTKWSRKKEMMMDQQEPGNPYTHWMYFKSKPAAQACAAALPEYRIKIDPPDADTDEWLLRAERNVVHTVARHAEVEAIVINHGGWYDGGETSFSFEGIIPDPFLGEGEPTSLPAERVREPKVVKGARWMKCGPSISGAYGCVAIS